MNYVWRGLSLITGTSGIIVLVGLAIAVINEMNSGGTYAALLPWAVLLPILLIVAYITHWLGRSDW